jgi:hypothetical protein
MDAVWVNLECNFDAFTVTVKLAAYLELTGKDEGWR